MNILLIENSAKRSYVVRQVLLVSGLVSRLHTVGDIVEALAYLRRETPYAEAPRPDCVLIGKNPPETRDCELIHSIRDIPQLAKVHLLALRDTWSGPIDHEHVADTLDCCDIRLVEMSRLVQTLNELDASTPSTERTHLRMVSQ